MDPIGVGIIGVWLGAMQTPTLLDDSRVGKVVLCDVDAEWLSRHAAEAGVDDVTTSWRVLVEREDIHLIYVSAPDNLHPEMSIEAMKAGKHVLCEKPMAPTLSEARDILRTVRETGMKLMVNHPLRFSPRFRRAKTLVEDGTLGRVYAAEGDYLHNTLHLIRGGWRGPVRHSVMTGDGVHLIDILLWMLGDVEEAFCYSSRAILTLDELLSPECMLAVLKFKSGCNAKCMTNMALQKPNIHNLVLYGTSGVFINGIRRRPLSGRRQRA